MELDQFFGENLVIKSKKIGDSKSLADDDKQQLKSNVKNLPNWARLSLIGLKFLMIKIGVVSTLIVLKDLLFKKELPLQQPPPSTATTDEGNESILNNVISFTCGTVAYLMFKSKRRKDQEKNEEKQSIKRILNAFTLLSVIISGLVILSSYWKTQPVEIKDEKWDYLEILKTVLVGCFILAMSIAYL